MNIIFILLFVLIFFYLNQNILIEKFNAYQTYQSYQSFIPKFPLYPLINQTYYPNWYTNLPWWNTLLGNTSNMSYDLRSDPLIIPRTNFIWNNGTNFPIYNQGI